MKEWLKTWYNKYAVVICGAACSLAAYQGVMWRSLTPSDWGTWIAAIGTVGALIGTIYLADTEARRRRQAELTRAKLAAARIKQKIAAAAGITRGLHVTLKTAAEIHPPKENFAVAATKLRDISFWSYEDLVALAPLQNGIAFRLAQAEDEILAVAGSLEKAVIRYERFEPDDRREMVLKLSEMLLLVAYRLEISWTQCKELIPEDPVAS